MTPLMYGVMGGATDVLNELHRHRARLKLANVEKMNILHIAAKYAQKASIDWIRDKNVMLPNNVNEKDSVPFPR